MRKTREAKRIEKECDTIAQKHALEYHMVLSSVEMYVFVWSDEHGFIDGHTIKADLLAVPQLNTIPDIIENLCEVWYKTLPRA